MSVFYSSSFQSVFSISHFSGSISSQIPLLGSSLCGGQSLPGGKVHLRRVCTEVEDEGGEVEVREWDGQEHRPGPTYQPEGGGQGICLKFTV
jgi:hypothetical protein